MQLLIAMAHAATFDVGPVGMRPAEHQIALSEQVVLGRTFLSSTRLDGATVLLPGGTWSLGVTGHGQMMHIGSQAGRYTHAHHAGGGIWFNLHLRPEVQHHIGVLASVPFEAERLTFALREQETGIVFGLGYRLHIETSEVDIDTMIDANLNTATLLGGTLGTTVSWKANDQLALQGGGMLGISEYGWLTAGARFRPVERVEIGATAHLAVPLLDGVVHVTPMVSVRLREPVREPMGRSR